MKTRGFSYRRVVNRRKALISKAMRPYMEARLIGNTVSDFCDDIMAEMPPTVSRDAVFESVRIFAGTQLSRRTALEIAWRLAGNIDDLIAGKPVLPWEQQVRDEVIPVRVEKMRPEKRKDTWGYILYCRALAGSPCPMVFPKFCSKRSCDGIARNIGFSAAWGLYPFQHPMYLVNLMFFAHVEAARSQEFPFFHQVSCNTGLKADNRAKIEVRCRVRGCPRNFQHQCAQCPIGYDQCPAGIYPKTLVSRPCSKCNTTAFFEPDDEDSRVCLNCRQTSHQSEKVQP